MNEATMALFVRGKYQLARYEPGSPATGRRLTEHEVVEAYGPEVIREVDEQLSAVLLTGPGVIEHSLESQRNELGVTRNQLASASDMALDDIDLAETNSNQLGLRELEHLAFVLGLNPAKLSVDDRAGSDPALGVRLRVLETDQAAAPTGARLGPQTVLRFSEAASIIRSQLTLQDWLAKPNEKAQFEPSTNYGPQAWRAGYRLARETRRALGIGLQPINSMRELVEHRLGIPVVQVELPPEIAGATISAHGKRGIVLNITGRNENVWIRRTTLAHELGHLLFDPEERLASVRVDTYEQVARNAEHDDQLRDIEQRANAFAVEFLAPREAVKQIVTDPAYVSTASIEQVMSDFGIGRAAARFHVGNAWWGQAELPPEPVIRATPTDDQKAAEDFTVTYFQPIVTPDQRRGRFASLAAEAVDAGLITADTAAQYLVCTEDEVQDALPFLRDVA